MSERRESEEETYLLRCDWERVTRCRWTRPEKIPRKMWMYFHPKVREGKTGWSFMRVM